MNPEPMAQTQITIQKAKRATMHRADMKCLADLSYRVAILRKSLSLQNMRSIAFRCLYVFLQYWTGDLRLHRPGMTLAH